MQIFRIDGTDRYVAADNRPLAATVFRVQKKSLRYLKPDELQGLLLGGCFLEVTEQPPVIRRYRVSKRLISETMGTGQSLAKFARPVPRPMPEKT